MTDSATNSVLLRASGMVKATGRWEVIGEATINKDDLEDPSADRVYRWYLS